MDRLGIQSWSSLAAGGLVALGDHIDRQMVWSSYRATSGWRAGAGVALGGFAGLAGFAGVALGWLAVGSKSQRLNAPPSSSQASQAANGPGMSSAPCRIWFSI